MIRVGIAGIGFMGMIHYHAIKRIKGARVEAISTRDAKKLSGDWTSIRGNFGPPGGHEDLRGVRKYADFNEMLADPKLDVIDICLPTSRHPDATIAALKAGKHVIVEKPIAIKQSDGKKMMATAKKMRRKLFVAHVLPFFPEFKAALELAHSGRYGKIVGAHLRRIISMPAWYTRTDQMAAEGGAALDLHIHDTHYIRLLSGMPKAVFSRGLQRQGVVQYVSTNYIYGDPDLTVSCTSGAISMSGRPFTHGFEIYMQKGSLFFEWGTPLTLLTPDGKRQNVKVGSTDPVDAFVGELTCAFDALSGRGRGELVSGEGALAALNLVYAEIESVRTGKVVRL